MYWSYCYVLPSLLAMRKIMCPYQPCPRLTAWGKMIFSLVVQGGHYHKAYIWQLPTGAGCACKPSGNNGYVQYNESGTYSADSLFTRNPSTGATSIAYYDSAQNKVGEQIGNIGGKLNGAANQILQPSTGMYGLSGVVDLSGTGAGVSIMAVMGVGNLNTLSHNGFAADTGGAGIITDSAQITVRSKDGISFGWNNWSYTFPKTPGFSGQVLTTNGGGKLSWQSVTGAAPGDSSGSVPYAGATGDDSLFTRSPSTLQTSIAYYENPDVKTGEQVKNVVGMLDGAANQMYQQSTGNYGVSGVVDATPVGGKSMTAVMGIVNLPARMIDVVSVDTGGPQMQFDSMHAGLSQAGLYFRGNNGKYTFPNYQGTAGQVLTTDSAGNISWQTPTGGGAVQTVHISVSSAQILTMVTSPVQLIAAPGSGRFIQILGITGRLNFNTTAYVDTPAVSYPSSYNSGLGVYFDATDLGVYYNTNILFASQTMYSTFNFSNGSFGVDNAPLMLSVYDTGPVPTNPYAGDGTLDIYVTYTVVNE